ncbi:hypothetical protein, partial [Pseudomonas sp. BJa3]|uniref:hypothetical protein n=1 Tax=Pseudomonas sp. BJa3 TaxID=2986525 RepID=UPI002265CAFA
KARVSGGYSNLSGLLPVLSGLGRNCLWVIAGLPRDEAGESPKRIRVIPRTDQGVKSSPPDAGQSPLLFGNESTRQ